VRERLRNCENAKLRDWKTGAFSLRFRNRAIAQSRNLFPLHFRNRAIAQFRNLLFIALAAAGCRQDMFNQPKLLPLQSSTFFADGRASRPLPEDTVARGQLHGDDLLSTGRIGGAVADRFPFPITAAVLDRGQQRFDIFCSPCHGRTGDGNGMVVQRGFKPPPSFHADRLRQAPAGHFFDVMTNGFGVMYDYRSRIVPEDRWAIAAYIRALQLSQHADASDLDAAREAARAHPASPAHAPADEGAR